MIYYVALPFVRIDEGLAPGEAVECQHAAAAVRRAEALATREPNAGAVAFYRQGSPDLGEFEDAVILKTFGEVPDDIRA
ncbi:hypothetical protein [Rhodoplanes sp. SY1]|uniref:hypothetical protein n=1 Tax=Rhodoplanes sp. SY1 TaxID=3166646 RepID=UPI0038B5C1C0